MSVDGKIMFPVVAESPFIKYVVGHVREIGGVVFSQGFETLSLEG